MDLDEVARLEEASEEDIFFPSDDIPDDDILLIDDGSGLDRWPMDLSPSS